MSEFKNAIENYAKYVVQQSRSRLSKEGKNKGSLYKSLSYIILQNRGASGRFESGYTVTFDMDDYGKFVDQGVKGNDPSKVSPNAKIKGQQAPNSKYKFGSGTHKGTFKDFVAKMTSYAQKKNMRFREHSNNKSTGRFAKGGYKSMGYVIASNIYNRGLRPTLFFTKPFESYSGRFGDKIVVAYGNEILKKLVKK